MKTTRGVRTIVAAFVSAGMLAPEFAIAAAAVGNDAVVRPPAAMSGVIVPDVFGLTKSRTADEEYQLAFEPGNTSMIVRSLQEVTAECRSVPAEYRIDCVGQGLKWAAGRVSAPDYASANSVLRQAGDQLIAIARKHADPAKPELQANTADNNAWKRPRKYRAVKRASLSAANAEARQVIDAAVAKLLRAAESSAERRVHYTKIATALESTKTLLRSS